jgi:hypothetical protein
MAEVRRIDALNDPSIDDLMEEAASVIPTTTTTAKSSLNFPDNTDTFGLSQAEH